MTRTILAMTTAIALALPAAAQTNDAREVVVNVLTENGYEETAIDALSNAQIAELYLVSTSESPFEVRRTLAGYDLTPVEPADAPEADIVPVVEQALAENGYPAEAAQYLTRAEMVEIYATVTSDEGSDLASVLRGIDFPTADEMAAMEPREFGDSLDRAVNNFLTENGYPEGTVDSLTDSQKAELYFLSTSGDDTPTQQEIDVIVNS